LTEWARNLMDRLAASLPQEALQRIEEAFLTSSRFEYAFWEMAYHLEQWPV
jgi:thiaminase/transcriptional activator TenA